MFENEIEKPIILICVKCKKQFSYIPNKFGHKRLFCDECKKHNFKNSLKKYYKKSHRNVR